MLPMDGNYAFRANNDETIKEMLKSIGLQSLDELFKDIPDNLKVKKRPDNFPKPHSELEAYQRLNHILQKNKPSNTLLSFIGSGVWDHYVPAVVSEIQNRAEFRTSYTPYAPELSQGMLTALFEYQSMVAELTGLNATNSSMYDWSTAVAEAALMAARLKKSKKPTVLIAKSVLSDRYETVKTYCDPQNITLEFFNFDPNSGMVDINDLKNKLTNDVVGVYVESPNLFGIVEENLKEIINLVHEFKAVVIVGVDPISLGILEAPGNLGADICVGEAQALGAAPNFGGPLIGFLTAEDNRNNLRNIPGRIIGYTRTKDDQDDAYVMTLQTREQHIRREKATSNICSNEALFSVAVTTYLSLIGPEGLADIGQHVMGRVGYFIEKISSTLPQGFEIPFKKAPHFKEVLITMPTGTFDTFRNFMMEKGILIGRNVGKCVKDLGKDAIVLSFTEKHSFENMNTLIDVITSFKGGN